MTDPAAFYSYVRKDDEHERGNLTKIRKCLAVEIEMQTGQEFIIFQDRDDILWGQRWQARIERSIDGTTLLIPIMTPAFLRSENCRSEVQRFLEREAALGRDDLIFPIYYIEAPGLDDPDDPIAAELRTRQWADWRSLRFAPLDGMEARQMLAQLAKAIVAALQPQSPASAPLAVHSPKTELDEDDQPGFVELVAETEDAMPMFTEVINEFAAELIRISNMAEEATADLTVANSESRPAAARLVRIRRFAEDMRDPADAMATLAAEYGEQLARVDGGLVAMTERVPTLTEVADIAAARELLDGLTVLDDKAGEGLPALAGFSDVLRQTGRLSRTVRPVFRTIMSSLDSIVGSRGTFTRWRSDLEGALAQLELEME